MRVFLAIAALLCSLMGAQAVSTISPAHSFSWAGNIGWINWRADETNGVEITASYCSGYFYSANVGWINLGRRPRQGVRYSNLTDDYGVNIESNGDLRGYAYGANIGWISFQSQGSPKIDLTNGKMSGSAYSANIGWLTLGDPAAFIQNQIGPDQLDADKDGISDAWEIQYAGTLNRFTATSDFDGDGVTDLAEFRNGTNPSDPADPVRILSVAQGAAPNSVKITWTTSGEKQYSIESSDRLLPAAWNPAATTQGAPGLNKTTLTLTISGNTKFFRIRSVN
jgi:hypothetical protein